MVSHGKLLIIKRPDIVWLFFWLPNVTTKLYTGVVYYGVVLHFVITVEFPEEALGVLREVWYDVDYDSTKSPTMRGNPVFKGESRSQITLRDFDAPVNVGTKYVQRLACYLQVKLHFRRGYSLI